MKAMSKRAMLGSGAAALMLFSGAALAHPGHLGSEGALGFVAGFMLATLGLHLAGLFAGFRLKHWNLWLSRALGVGIAGYGALLFVGARV